MKIVHVENDDALEGYRTQDSEIEPGCIVITDDRGYAHYITNCDDGKYHYRLVNSDTHAAVILTIYYQNNQICQYLFRDKAYSCSHQDVAERINDEINDAIKEHKPFFVIPSSRFIAAHPYPPNNYNHSAHIMLKQIIQYDLDVIPRAHFG